MSITLYDQTAGLPGGDAWAEWILFHHSDGRGVYKRTYGRRFERFDALVVEQITRTFDNDRALVIHDAGVSDARTACDFFRKIAARFPNLSYHASDFEPALSMLRWRNITVSMNKQEEILEICRRPSCSICASRKISGCIRSTISSFW